MNFKIERGVPIPDRHRLKRHYLQSVLRQMRAGDSIYFPGLDTRNLYQAGVTAFGQHNFTTRRESGGARIWRIS